MGIKCHWCEEEFLTYAKLTVHQLIIRGVAKCRRHPDIPKDQNQYRLEKNVQYYTKITTILPEKKRKYTKRKD